MKKGISIIIPVYNREKVLGIAIESILSQNDYTGEFEIIISDDGSSDKSIEVARSYGDKVKILTKPLSCSDQGAAGARNRGIAEAQYSYISFLDSDDYYLPRHLKTMSDYLDSNPDKGFVFCRSKKKVIKKDGTVVITNWTRSKMRYLDVNYPVLFRSYGVNTNTIFSRKEVFDKVGGFNTEYSNGEDSDLWIRMSENFNVGFVDFYGSCYVTEHQLEQLTNNDNKNKTICAKLLLTAALGRSITTEKTDKIRLLLIIRTLLYLKQGAKNRLPVIIHHFIVMIQLFVLFPATTLRFLSLINKR